MSKLGVGGRRLRSQSFALRDLVLLSFSLDSDLTACTLVSVVAGRRCCALRFLLRSTISLARRVTRVRDKRDKSLAFSTKSSKSLDLARAL